jgi:pyruvate/2-oxoglutarate dehydrogenase complex dihydrolipoamide acyltransferase (E2) component
MYKTKPISIFRLMVQDATKISKNNPVVFALAELDITEVRKKIRECRKNSTYKPTLFSYLLYCFIKTVDEKKELHAIKDWRRRLVIFDSIDVFVPVEITYKNERVLFFKIIRSSNFKTMEEMDTEIRKVKENSNLNLHPLQIAFIKLPSFIKQLFYSVWMSLPKRRKELFGTVYFSGTSMNTDGLAWGIPFPVQTLGVYLGNINKVQVWVNGVMENREKLYFTVSVDHSVIDGEDMGRFTNNYKKNIVANLSNLVKP